MTKTLQPARTCLGFWISVIEICLGLGIWDFEFLMLCLCERADQEDLMMVWLRWGPTPIISIGLPRIPSMRRT